MVNPPDGIYPARFTFSAQGLKESISVRIPESLNTEYYRIVCRGPYNGLPATVAEKSVVGRPGLNVIELDNPAGTDPDFDTEEPGIYTVAVYAFNNSCFTNGDEDYDLAVGADNNGDFGQYVSVNYELYPEQKTCEPAVSSALFGLGAIDLEVNFNDGSGWYRLKLSSDDYTDGSAIDCRLSSYMEQNRQKFFIAFTPPAGSSDQYSSLFDVFRGGREEVDVYVRTVAEKKYRDTLWLKPQSGEYHPDMNSIQSDLGVFSTNFIESWIDCAGSDATSVESYREGGLLDVEDSGFVIQTGGINSLFFSPLEERKYRIKASFIETLPMSSSVVVDEPSFDISLGERSIIVSNMVSEQATGFRVFWKPGSSTGDYEDIYQAPWSHYDAYESAGGYSYTIEDLTARQDYLVAVVAFRDCFESEPVYYDANSLDALPYSPITAATMEIPEAPDMLPSDISYVSADNSILVSNIYTRGCSRYRVYWNEQIRVTEGDDIIIDPEGTRYDIENLENSTILDPRDTERYSHSVIGAVTDPASLEWSSALVSAPDSITPVSTVIRNLAPWERYVVMVRALDYAGVGGELFFVTDILTDAFDFAGTVDAEFVNVSTSHVSGTISLTMFSHAEVEYLRCRGNIEIIPSLPENTYQYRLRYTMNSIRDEVSGESIIAVANRPVESAWVSWRDPETPVTTSGITLYKNYTLYEIHVEGLYGGITHDETYEGSTLWDNRSIRLDVEIEAVNDYGDVISGTDTVELPDIQ